MCSNRPHLSTLHALWPNYNNNNNFYYYTHTPLTALCPGLPRWAGTRKIKPMWILLKQETVSGSGISWAVCKSAPRSRQTTTPAPHHSVFYRPDALPATQPTVSKHWRHTTITTTSLLDLLLQRHSLERGLTDMVVADGMTSRRQQLGCVTSGSASLPDSEGEQKVTGIVEQLMTGEHHRSNDCRSVDALR